MTFNDFSSNKYNSSSKTTCPWITVQGQSSAIVYILYYIPQGSPIESTNRQTSGSMYSQEPTYLVIGRYDKTKGIRGRHYEARVVKRLDHLSPVERGMKRLDPCYEDLSIPGGRGLGQAMQRVTGPSLEEKIHT